MTSILRTSQPICWNNGVKAASSVFAIKLLTTARATLKAMNTTTTKIEQNRRDQIAAYFLGFRSVFVSPV